MKLIITIILGITLGIIAFYFAENDPGLVNIKVAGYDLTSSLLVFIAGLGIALILLYLAISLIVWVFNRPKKYRGWRKEKAIESAQNNTMKGLAQLIEGNWNNAEDSLLTNIQHNKSALINYLGLAYSAQQRGMNNRRDIYLDDARKKFPKQDTAIDLTHARLNYQAGEYDQARVRLEALRTKTPKNTATVRLLADVYERTSDWDSLTALLPVAKKLKALPETDLNYKEKLTYENVLNSGALLVDDSGNAKDTWKSLPRKQKKNPNVVLGQVGQLVSAGKNVEAEKLARKTLNSRYDTDLAYAYGNIDTDFSSDQIKLVNSWKKRHPDEAVLDLNLAKLNMRANHHDIAKEQFQNIISSQNIYSSEACRELGRLLENIGEKDAALLCYRKGLENSVGLTAVASDQEALGYDDGEADITDASELVKADEADSNMVIIPGAEQSELAKGSS